MIMDEKTTAVIAKVRKLLAMAQGNANEHEAAVAASKAQDLLEAYNLDMAIISRADNKFAARAKENRAGGLYKWQRNLWNATAELNFCMYWYIKGNLANSQYEHQILGSHANVIGTEVMAKYLEQTIERLARQWVHTNRPGKSVFIKEAIAYREGMAERLTHRLWNLRHEHLEEERKRRTEERARNKAAGVNTENALVLQDVMNTEEDLNRDHLYGYEPGTTAKLRAEREARQAAAEKAAAELMARQAEWDEAHPVEAAKRKAKEAKEQAELYAKWAKQANSRKGRYRKMSAEEERRQLSSFGEGYSKGADVSLNRQVDERATKRIQ
jgi:hypothetical protein